jgi:hypothetical protein
MFFNELQIAYQARSVVSSVSIVNVFQPITRKALALETIGDFTFEQFGTMLPQKRTFLVSRSAAYASGHPDSFCPQIILQSQVG